MAVARGRMPWRLGGGVAAACAVLLLLAGLPAPASDTVVTGKAYGPGEYRIAGHSLSCGSVRTVISSGLSDYGAWVPGTIVLNPQRLSRLSTSARLFVYAHECGHQVHGRSEAAADCHAAQRGRRDGWLAERDIAGICGVFPRSLAHSSHGTRGARCAVIRACFAGRAAPSQLAGSRSYEAAARGFAGR